MGRDWLRTTFWDTNVDPGPCLTLQNHAERMDRQIERQMDIFF